MGDLYFALTGFMEQGGNVLWLIAALTFLLWTLVFERWWYFRTEHKQVIQSAMDQWEQRGERRSWSAHAIRDGIISETAERITGNLALVQTCVALAPLLGLLGTVTGMVTVFEAMATQGGNARSMAAGVSQATIPTMAGMIVSLSGLLGTTWLQRKVDYSILSFEDNMTSDH
ncbi:MAG: MotA/TolQ/ExbB proton channel family protein [Pseudomonadota bacterium]